MLSSRVTGVHRSTVIWPVVSIFISCKVTCNDCLTFNIWNSQRLILTQWVSTVLGSWVRYSYNVLVYVFNPLHFPFKHNGNLLFQTEMSQNKLSIIYWSVSEIHLICFPRPLLSSQTVSVSDRDLTNDHSTYLWFTYLVSGSSIHSFSTTLWLWPHSSYVLRYGLKLYYPPCSPWLSSSVITHVVRPLCLLSIEVYLIFIIILNLRLDL